MTPEKQKMIDELKRLMEAERIASMQATETPISQAEYRIVWALLALKAIPALPALLEEVEKGPKWEQGIRDAAAIATDEQFLPFTGLPLSEKSLAYNAASTEIALRILALLPPAPASDDAREEK